MSVISAAKNVANEASRRCATLLEKDKPVATPIAAVARRVSAKKLT